VENVTANVSCGNNHLTFHVFHAVPNAAPAANATSALRQQTRLGFSKFSFGFVDKWWDNTFSAGEKLSICVTENKLEIATWFGLRYADRSGAPVDWTVDQLPFMRKRLPLEQKMKHNSLPDTKIISHCTLVEKTKQPSEGRLLSLE
jgi:hypothetical protein